MGKSFSDEGYLIIKNAISGKLLVHIQEEISNYLDDFNHNKNKDKKAYYDFFFNKVKSLKGSEYEFQKPIWELLSYKGLIDKFLLEKKIYAAVTDVLGKDLAYINEPSFNLNLPNKDSPKKNYLFKDWHQEIWSGASISNIQIWTPIFQKDSCQGQLELMAESHKWGHIPHRNRAPIELPKKYKTIKPNLECRDIIIFSTLMLHRSVPAKYPRLSITLQIKNFKYKTHSFLNENVNWKIFSYSDLTKIEKILGNHYLSPYRVVDLNTDLIPGTVRKN